MTPPAPWYALLLVLTLALPLPAAAQSAEARIRAQRQELDRIRRERAELESRMSNIQGNVHELREEVANLDRQREATERVIQTLDRQLVSITKEVDETTARMQTAERELNGRRATLERRLVEIYKRGPLYSAEALLTARSFGELVARYKYLHELATRDRALVTRVQALRDHVAQQRADLVRLDGWFAEDFPMLTNVANGAILLSLFAATAQLFNSLLPEQGLPFWIVAFCFFWTLWNNLFADFDTKKLLRSLGALFGLAFVVKYLVLANLTAPTSEGWLRGLLENPTKEAFTWLLDLPRFSAGTGYIQFFTAALYLLGLFLLPVSTRFHDRGR